MMEAYDVIVIGSGGGMNIARPAAATGLRVAFIEEDAAGGTCLNRGCIPSKMLIYPNELADTIRDSRRLDLHVDAPSVDFRALVTRLSGIVDDVSAGIRRSIEEAQNIDLLPEHAQFVSDKVVRVGGEEITADKIFIATGSRPYIPDIPGLAEVPYMTSREALRRTELPQRLVVLGAGYIAVELGGAYRAAGAEVSFIVRSRLMRKEDREIAGEFARVFAQRHTIHAGYLPVRFDHDGQAFTVSCTNAQGQPATVTGDALLVAAGVSPCTDSLGLENTGVTRDADGYILVDDYLRTGVEGVYALGDVIGRHLYRHTVNYEGEYLMKTAFSADKPHPIEYGPVPHAVFGHPQIAGVGMTEEQVRETGVDYVVGRATYADSTPGMARRSDHGLVKILADRSTRKILGAHIVGDEASNMIHLFIAMMKKGGTLDDLLDMIFIHPALPEVARDAARDAAANLSSAQQDR